MADGDTTTIDPNTGQPTGWMNDLTQAFSNPLVQGLMGLSAGFGQAAMPTRMRLPFGAVLGMGMGGFGQGIGNAYKMQQEQAQAQNQQLQTQLLRAQMPAKIAQANMQRSVIDQILQNPDMLRSLGLGNAPPTMAPQLPGQGPPGAAATPPVVPPGQSPSPTDAGAGAVGKPGELPPPPKLATVVAPSTGAKLSVAEPYQDRFQGLVSDLDAAGYRIDPATSGGYNNRFIAGTNIPSEHAYGRAIDVNWTQNPQGGTSATTIPPDLAHQLAAKYDMTWGGDWSGKSYDPMHFQIAQPQPQAGRYQVAQAGGPPTAPAAPGAAAAPPVGQGTPGVPSPAQALQMAADLNRRAQLGDLTGMPLYGDPAMLRQQAQIYMRYGLAPSQANLEELAKQQAQLQYAGPIAGAQAQAQKQVALQYDPAIESAKTTAQKQVSLQYDPVIEAEKARLSGQYKPETMRPGTVNRMNVGGQMQWVGTPAAESVNAPDGTAQHVWVTPPTPDHPTPVVTPMLNPQTGQPLVEKIAPQLQEQRNEAAKEFATKGSESFTAAQNTQAWLNQIDNAAATMNKPGGPGYLNTGPYAQLRYSIVSQINDALRTAGASPSTLIDPTAIGSWEELKKATTTAGFELSSHYEGHARQAATTIQNATAAVPGEANSPQGMVNVSAGVREGSNTSIDAYNYAAMVNRLTNGAGLVDAPVDFYKAVPATMYADRAISINHPVTVSDPKDLTKYLPGTFFVSPSRPGEVRQVPDRSIEIGTVQTERGPVTISLPFTAPRYLQNLQRFAAQAGAQTGGR